MKCFDTGLSRAALGLCSSQQAVSRRPQQELPMKKLVLIIAFTLAAPLAFAAASPQTAAQSQTQVDALYGPGA